MPDAPSPAANPQGACPHYHRRLIAKDDVLEFAECLDCGEILEAEPRPACVTEPEAESLGDA